MMKILICNDETFVNIGYAVLYMPRAEPRAYGSLLVGLVHPVWNGYVISSRPPIIISINTLLQLQQRLNPKP